MGAASGDWGGAQQAQTGRRRPYGGGRRGLKTPIYIRVNERAGCGIDTIRGLLPMTVPGVLQLQQSFNGELHVALPKEMTAVTVDPERSGTRGPAGFRAVKPSD